MKRRYLMKWGAGAALLMVSGLSAGFATAQGPVDGYPSRAMDFIVPYPPGGISDSRSRIIAEYLSRQFGQNVLVENIPGASGILGVQRLANAPADGHTLMSNTSSGMIVVPQLTPVDYIPMELLVPVANVFSNPTVIMVAQDSPYQTIQDVIEDARERPGRITFASPGANSLYHLAGEIINVYGDVELVHVPYAGAAQYTIDLLAGRVDLAIGTMGTLAANAEQLRGLVVASETRSTIAPDVPTGVESGLPELSVPDGSGVFVHIDTPQEVVDLLSDQMASMVEDPDMQEQFVRLGLEVDYIPSGEFIELLEQQHGMIAELIEQAGLAAE